MHTVGFTGWVGREQPYPFDLVVPTESECRVECHGGIFSLFPFMECCVSMVHRCHSFDPGDFKSLGQGSLPAVSSASSVRGACCPAETAGLVLRLRGWVPSPRLWVALKRPLLFYYSTWVHATKPVNWAVWMGGCCLQAFKKVLSVRCFSILNASEMRLSKHLVLIFQVSS